MTPIESFLARTLLWATAATAAAVPVFVLPQPEDPLFTVIVHLSLLVLFGLALTFHLAPLADPPWFGDIGMGEMGRRALTWISVIAAVTASLVPATIATAAAIRYEASVQFLLLLAALGTAAFTGATVLGARRRFGGRPALGVGVLVVVACVWAVVRYLRTVGFTPAGGWVVEGGEIARLIVPVAAVVGVVATGMFSAGVRASKGR